MENRDSAKVDAHQEALENNLLIMSKEMFTYMTTSLQLILGLMGISRVISKFTFGIEIANQQIIGPIAFCIGCIFISFKMINKYQDLSMIASIIQIVVYLLFTETLISTSSNLVVMDTILVIRMSLLVDQFQLFPQKFQLGYSCVLYVFIYGRIVTAYPQNLFQPDLLLTLVVVISLEYLGTSSIKGIKYFLIKYLGQVQMLDNRWHKLLKNLKVGISIFEGSSLDIDFINGSMLNIFEIKHGSHFEILQQMKEVMLLEKVQNQKQVIGLLDYLQQKFQKIREKCVLEEQEGDIFKIKGMKKVIEISFQDYLQEDNTVLVQVNDITSMKKLEKSKQLDKMKQVYFCSVAHDLKTPINSIVATNEVLLSKFSNDGQLLKLLKATKMSCFYLLRIIQDIMDLSKIEFNQLSLDHSWFSVKVLLQEVQDLMQFSFEMKRLGYNFEIRSPILNNFDPIIYSDPKRIKQILFNLIGNAVKFTLSGHVSVSVALQSVSDSEEEEKFEEMKYESAEDEEERVLAFAVTDTGVGIREENQKYLFKLFAKSRESQDVNKQGIGLGSTICKRLTEILGGQINFNSELGKGSTFTFTIKCKLKHGNLLSSQNDCNIETELDGYKFLTEDYLKTQFFDLFFSKENKVEKTHHDNENSS